ncbi:DNA oxidative demethylase AlkB [Acidocella aromatica]|uniref:Alkylated DNA repair protein (DNA oxidative demethylase) n=1 Tax=Acidocella aromatica TaxID=1303579 RepID=A0A840VRB6_9PROT|nr:DNA oxidative demethylase AlkB [Acidocella aromatica]MBB5373910.1 alkylated DNA repair protein (DNA oxidative demethylase) [Acidocella aromatica]
MTPDLFGETAPPGLAYLPGFALAEEAALIGAALGVAAAAPLRVMSTPGGKKMSVAATNCGAAGWVSDARGYRYERRDPLTSLPWPAMPGLFLTLAQAAAAQAGFAGFNPDACLINCYEPGAKMALHQDKDEADLTAPIVSISLGLPAVFLWGGANRSDKPARLPLHSGDVVVWGGATRLNFHGIAPLPSGHHPPLGAARLNLTFRRALRA